MKQYYQGKCKTCSKKRWKAWSDAQPKSKKNEYTIKYRHKLREQILKHYGNKCICCGEATYEFLTFDHVNGDGAEIKKTEGIGQNTGVGLLLWIKRNDYPNTIQILCFNCNCGKARNNNVCPHITSTSP